MIGLSALVIAGCDSSTQPELPPHLGVWTLVRLGGQPLPHRVDDVEIVSETVTFIAGGGGSINDRRVIYNVFAGDTVPSQGGCNGWISASFVNGVVSTSPDGIESGCGPLGRFRTYRLDGDTLRLTSTDVFLSQLSRAYVKRDP